MIAAVLALCVTPGLAQGGGGGSAAAAAPTAREAAQIDFTGYWTAIVDEDWRHRMFTAQRGDYQLLPLNDAGQTMADAWTGEEEPSEGECLKTFGAAGIMRLPTHLEISWEDDNTLRVDLDTGTQTRLFYFDESQAYGGALTLQGYSVAEWESYGGLTGRGGGVSTANVPFGGNMRVETTNMSPGFYLKNGLPYSGNAHMTEFFVQLTEANGDEYLLVQTFVDDPQYLTQHYVRTLTFKKLPDGSLWNPSPCTEY